MCPKTTNNLCTFPPFKFIQKQKGKNSAWSVERDRRMKSLIKATCFTGKENVLILFCVEQLQSTPQNYVLMKLIQIIVPSSQIFVKT